MELYLWVEKSKNPKSSSTAAINLIMNMRKQSLAMIHTQYDKVINMEEFVDVFAQLNTRKLQLSFNEEVRYKRGAVTET